jgi:hypothetical protein
MHKKQYNNGETRQKLNQVIPLHIELTRSLNGKPLTHKQMKSYTFKSETLSKIISTVNKRMNPHNVAPDDNPNYLC